MHTYLFTAMLAVSAATSASNVHQHNQMARPGVDYVELGEATEGWPTPGKIQVAEVFAYFCIHCARMQSRVDNWLKAIPPDVEFRYVPVAHGSPAEPIARGFYAALAMDQIDQTHQPMFQAIAVDRKLRGGTVEAVAALYGELGLDQKSVLATMESFFVDAQIARTQRVITLWAVEDTPTFIVNGRYKVLITSDRGHDGALRTVDELVERERRRLATEPTEPPPLERNE